MLNFGPQHPAAHGVLRLVLSLDGEYIQKADPQIGLLHRGTEKLSEHKSFLKALPYLDRLDYVSRRFQEYVLSTHVEKLLNISLDKHIYMERKLFLDITRILNHIRALTTHALDVGALTPFLWGFEERENLMALYEKVCGSRRHASFIRPGGLSYHLKPEILRDCKKCAIKILKRVNDRNLILSENPIWLNRLKGIGIIKTKKTANSFGISGPRNRSIFSTNDLRLTRLDSNSIQQAPHFSEIVQTKLSLNADCLDRYLIRLEEIKCSAYNILSLVEILCLKIRNKYFFEIEANTNILKINQRNKLKDNMENLIYHYKICSESMEINPSSRYSSYEASKGEFGLYSISKDNSNLYRLKIRAPGFYNLQSLNYRSKKQLLADLVTIIGTQDIVFGEIDR